MPRSVDPSTAPVGPILKLTHYRETLDNGCYVNLDGADAPTDGCDDCRTTAKWHRYDTEMAPLGDTRMAPILELLGATRRDGEFVLLIEPRAHRGILDVVEEILAHRHRCEYLKARSRLRARAGA